MPIGAVNSTTPIQVRNIATAPGAAFMEIDFVSPSDELKCLHCGGPGAIPLTCFCQFCDPILSIPEEEEVHRTPQHPPQGSHTNIMMLPRPANSNPPPVTVHPTGQMGHIRDALRAGRTPEPILIDPQGNPLIPSFLLRKADKAMVNVKGLPEVDDLPPEALERLCK